jgi:hypothetical protein
MKGADRQFFIEVAANIYKSGCERFRILQKLLRSVFSAGIEALAS